MKAIHDTPLTVRLLLLGLIFSCLGVYFDLWPCYQRWQDLEKIKIIQQEKYTQHLALLQQKEYLETESRTLSFQLSPFFHKNSEKLAILDMYSALLKASQVAGLTWDRLEPILETHRGELTLLRSQLMAHGSFENFIKFLVTLQDSELPLMIAHFELREIPNQRLNMRLTVVGFYIKSLNNDDVVPLMRRPRYCLAVQANPFRENISDISLRRMQFVGYLADAKQSWALALLPNQQIIPIQLHDIVGIEHARVLSINESRILVQQQGQTLRLNYRLGDIYGV